MGTITKPMQMEVSNITKQTIANAALSSESRGLRGSHWIAYLLCLFFPFSIASLEAQETNTLGLEPPREAIVLFDGTHFDAWEPFSFQWINPDNDQNEIQWSLVDNEAMQIAFEHNGKRRKQFLCTKKRFQDYRLHLEFQCPAEGSGNSGLFFGPLYELQILNSADKEQPGLGDCGAIYQIRAPDSNAALPPGRWQTIDLAYRAARIGKNGFMSEKNAARVTIRLNGQLIHDNVRLSLRRNKYAAYPEETHSPLVLQEHGSPVKFRNIWLVEPPTVSADEE